MERTFNRSLVVQLQTLKFRGCKIYTVNQGSANRNQGTRARNIERLAPDLQGRKPIVSGFIWFQGWNDMFNQSALREYEDNLVHLIKDVRKEFNKPELPAIIGELGNGGPKAGENMLSIREAQKAAARRKELGGNVKFISTTAFARPKEQSPNIGHGHHWFGNAESYFLIGDALGRGMVELLEE